MRWIASPYLFITMSFTALVRYLFLMTYFNFMENFMAKKIIAIVGAGLMGSDTALDIAGNGYQVFLKDLSRETLDNSKKRIEQDFKMAKMMKPDFAGLHIDDVLANIRFQLDHSDFDQAEIVIENIVEDLELKEREYSLLAGNCGPKAVFALNTSCISITKLASFLPDPSRVIGTHFMNPVPLKKMVEVIRGFHTSAETESLIVDFLKTLKKNAIVINDYPGFVSNRLSHLFMNEAAFLVQDNVATAAQVDAIFKQGYGHKMGPLETADLIGLDTVVRSLDILYQSYQDTKFRCCPLLRKMVDAGMLGKKSGIGFHKYDRA
jgi:3-hydroxybutyryl-CoA dehydrogenase